MEEPKKINTIRKIQSKRSEAFFLVIRGLEVGVAAGLIAAGLVGLVLVVLIHV